MKSHSRIAVVVAVVAGFAFQGAIAADAEILKSKSGMTIYTFDKDVTNKSNCGGSCLAVWPAVAPSDVAGKDFSSITRDDGSKQAAFKGQPVYYYVQDRAPGEAKGDNVGNVWHVIRPDSKPKVSSSNNNSNPYGY